MRSVHSSALSLSKIFSLISSVPAAYILDFWTYAFRTLKSAKFRFKIFYLIAAHVLQFWTYIFRILDLNSEKFCSCDLDFTYISWH